MRNLAARNLAAALLVACFAAAPLAADAPAASALAEGVQAMAAAPGAPRVSATALRLAVAAADRYLGERDPATAAPLVFAAAVRAELRLRLGAAVPRVRAEVAQELRVAARAGGDAAARVRLLERVRRDLERAAPGRGLPWWGRPRDTRGRPGA
jgi:hypothetical protein